MKLRKNLTSVILVGAWNKLILTPKWLKDNQITSKDKVEIDIAINNPTLPIRIALERVFLKVSDARVEINIKDNDENSYNDSSSVAKKLLNLLSHTPINGVGFNFHYIEDSPSKNILDIFELKDDTLINDLDSEVVERLIKRKIKIGEKILNLTYTLTTENKVLFHFNWHFDVSTAKIASEKIENNNIYQVYLQTEKIVKKISDL